MSTIYLYIKQHSVTGLKYFGKTIRNPNTYKGSGKRWVSHIKKHGIDKVETIQIWEFSDIQTCSTFAKKFSIENDIVASNEWANLMEENGYTGGGNQSAETREKLRNSKLNVKKSLEHRKKQSEVRLGKKRGKYKHVHKNYILCTCCKCKRTLPTGHLNRHKCQDSHLTA